MNSIDRIDRSPGLITFGKDAGDKDGGDAATLFVNRGAGTITAARLPADRSCAPAAPAIALAARSEETGLIGWTTGFVDSASGVTRGPAALTAAVS